MPKWGKWAIGTGLGAIFIAAMLVALLRGTVTAIPDNTAIASGSGQTETDGLSPAALFVREHKLEKAEALPFSELEGAALTGEPSHPLNGGEIIYRLENNSSDTLEYGLPYELHILNEEDWYFVPFKDMATFMLLLYTLKPHDAITFKFDPADHIDLPAGQYRITKDISASGKEYVLSVEFALVDAA
ncbi:hypothetical protein LJC27_00815 [Christensenellaceae bacterium OttesenSCG-928-M15]|nr:hypothetical protein [Christensenellaceae bacterium OttesenSCG-928-M15]